MRVWLSCLTLIALGTGPTGALEIAMPGNARLVAERSTNPDRYELPVGRYSEGSLPVVVLEGQVTRRAWRTEGESLTTLQITRALQEQLATAGFETVLDCGGQDCGGFDYRFNTYVMPAPDMYVDLFDFRALSARGPGGAAISALISKSAGVGYVQIIHVIPDGGVDLPKATTNVPVEDAALANGETVVDVLVRKGHVILKDLDFGTGSAALGPGPHASLQALAGFLTADEKRRVVLVGHTDTVGALEDNVSLSRRRATSVLTRLIEEYGVSADQISAEGVGFLSPIAPNTTRVGRDVNRRVEAVLLAVE